MDASNYRRARAIESNVVRLREGSNLTPVGLVGFGAATERRSTVHAIDQSVTLHPTDDRWNLRRSVVAVNEKSTTPDRGHLDGGCIREGRASGTALSKVRMCSSSSGQRGGRPDVTTTVADRESRSCRLEDTRRHDDVCPDDDTSSARMCGTVEPRQESRRPRTRKTCEVRMRQKEAPADRDAIENGGESAALP